MISFISKHITPINMIDITDIFKNSKDIDDFENKLDNFAGDLKFNSEDLYNLGKEALMKYVKGDIKKYFGIGTDQEKYTYPCRNTIRIALRAKILRTIKDKEKLNEIKKFYEPHHNLEEINQIIKNYIFKYDIESLRENLETLADETKRTYEEMNKIRSTREKSGEMSKERQAVADMNGNGGLPIYMMPKMILTYLNKQYL